MSLTSPHWLARAVENMKGSTVDAMSDAIEHAEVMLYGVSLEYKESANCRMELNVSVLAADCLRAASAAQHIRFCCCS